MKLLIGITALLISINVWGQEQYFTKTGTIEFYSHAPLEDITAVNKQTAAFVNAKTGEVTFAVLIKSFEFEKALMQEHFNENYLESDDYPKSNFKGAISDFSSEKLLSGEKYEFNVTGKLTIHGVTKDITAPAHLQLKNSKLEGGTKFIVKPEDYKIKIPSAVRDNIAKEIEVTVKVSLEAYKK
ncbi:MAG: YceI family protein [Bacteroidales bacterium]|nr:YceI family protein [Bacteroidales bacterium]